LASFGKKFLQKQLHLVHTLVKTRCSPEKRLQSKGLDAMQAEWKLFLEENRILALWDYAPGNEGEVIYICRECITEEDFPPDWDNPQDYRFRTEDDLKDDEVFVAISQFRPVRCYRCGREILPGYRFAPF
jgi:DNA-directed RNA polymerase subunit RPC12/RpoP